MTGKRSKHWALCPVGWTGTRWVWSVRECEVLHRAEHRWIVRWISDKRQTNHSEVPVGDVFASREQAERALALLALERE